MEYKLREQGDILVVFLKGDVDLQFSPALRRVLLDGLGQGRHVAVDLEGVDLIDSSGLACFLEACKVARDTARRFVVCGIGPKVARVIELARLQQILPLADDLDSALAAIGTPPAG